MTEYDDQFISDVKALSDNGTLKRLLDMIEQDCVDLWKVAPNAEQREHAWHERNGVNRLRGRIASLTTDENVRNFNRKINRRIS